MKLWQELIENIIGSASLQIKGKQGPAINLPTADKFGDNYRSITVAALELPLTYIRGGSVTLR